MNHTLLFTSPDSTSIAAQKALAVIEELGAPLKSDSGHFITGTIPHPGGTIEVHISWLATGDGTQLTVQTTGNEDAENAVFRTAERVRDTFLKTDTIHRGSSARGGINLPAMLVVLSLFVVVGIFFFIIAHH